MKIAICAGEASGDLLAAHLIESVKAIDPSVSFYGIAGPKMVNAGCEVWYDQSRLAVRGYVEVLKHLRGLLKLRDEFRKRLLADPPDLFIGVDAPDFNLALAAKLKAGGVRTMQYVSPSIWAWRPERIHTIKKSVHQVLALFPFEPAIYDKEQFPCTFVGHPMAGRMPMVPDRAELRRQLKMPVFSAPSAPVITLMPGSRESELNQHAELFLKAAQAIVAAKPDARFLVPVATRETRVLFEAALYREHAQALNVQIMIGHADMALSASDCAIIASGTATLEAALAKCPHVIAYKMPQLSYRIMKRKALQPYVGLPNILSGEFVVPELLQDEARPENLAQAVLNILKHDKAREAIVERFSEIHQRLALDQGQTLAKAVLNARLL
jgi:lipid-A-disaccharide synthase